MVLGPAYFATFTAAPMLVKGPFPPHSTYRVAALTVLAAIRRTSGRQRLSPKLKRDMTCPHESSFALFVFELTMQLTPRINPPAVRAARSCRKAARHRRRCPARDLTGRLVPGYARVGLFFMRRP